MKRLIVYPDEFFEEIGEGGIRDSLIYFILISFILLVLELLIFFSGFVPANFGGMQYIFRGGSEQLVVPLVYFAGGIGIVFLYSGLVLGFSRWRKLKAGYKRVFTGIAYGSTPAVLFAWVPVLNLLFGLWGWYLQIKGISKLNDISEKEGFILTVPVIIILGAVFFLASFLLAGYYRPT